MKTYGTYLGMQVAAREAELQEEASRHSMKPMRPIRARLARLALPLLRRSRAGH